MPRKSETLAFDPNSPAPDADDFENTPAGEADVTEQPAAPRVERAEEQGEDKPLDEVQAGGRYEVNGRLVDANGEPIKD